ncbi:RE2, partial [Symbiodinium necroappetens]
DNAHGYGNNGGHREWQTWGSVSSGPGSADGAGNERDSKDLPAAGQWGHQVSGGEVWSSREGSLPGGWGPSSDAQGKSYNGQKLDATRGPSERMVVPSFSGNTGDSGDDIGTTARSYLRQVAAWRRMTRLGEEQQGLTLYQHLKDKAWIDAERLDMDQLASRNGVDYLVEWVRERYLDVQVTQVGRSLSGFFRSLRRKANQTVRDYMADFDRAHSRLLEVGCCLPDVAAAWVFVDRMGLEEQAELNLLASVGNQYSLKALQQAAIVHDRGLRKPWETQSRAPRKEWNNNKKPFSANMADAEDNDLFDIDEAPEDDADEDGPVPEEVAQDLYQAYMTHATAKQKYRESAKLRGSDPESLKSLAAEKLKAAKARSFCAGCKRRGHWHKDAICPLNKGAGATTTSTSATQSPSSAASPKDPVRANYPCHVVHVTWEIEPGKPQDFLAITDTACSRSVVGASWIDSYIAETRRQGTEPLFISCKEAFKFGASKVFMAAYGVILGFEIGGHKIALRVAVVNGEVPLLVSRGALGKMGMVLDVEDNTASFKKLGVRNMALSLTDSGHPAFVVKPAVLPKSDGTSSIWDVQEIQIFPREAAYMGVPEGLGFQGSVGDERDEDDLCSSIWMVSSRDVPGHNPDELDASLERDPRGSSGSFNSIFYPKKIGNATKNLLLDVTFNPETFASWWSTTNISNDFWVENEDMLVRVHVIPRRAFFSPLYWKTTNSYHKQSLLQSLGTVRTINAISCKTHREFAAIHGTWDSSADDSALPMLWVGRSDLLTAPVVTRAKVLSEFTKAELIAEATARNLWFSSSWTTVEIRSLIQEDRKNPSGNHPADSGMSKMTVDQLKERAMELGYHLPPYATKGTIMRILRDQNGMGPSSILGFGRFKGKMFSETPESYRTWALREVNSNDNPSEDLVMFANWWQGELHRWRETPLSRASPSSATGYLDPEENATIPYVEDASSTTSWDMVTKETLSTTRPKSKAAPAQAPRTPPRRRPFEKDGALVAHMEQDIPAEVNDEVRYLEEIAEAESGGHEEEEVYYECEPDKEDVLEYSYGMSDQDGDFEDYDEAIAEDDTDDIMHDLLGINANETMAVIGGDHVDDINSGGSGDVFQRETTGVGNASRGLRSSKEKECEQLAKAKLNNQDFLYDDLLEIVKNLPLTKAKKGKALRRSGGLRFEYFLGGMYTHGNFRGLSKRSRSLPWTTKYVNAFMKSKHQGAWTSFVIFYNSATEVHTDPHNLPNVPVATVSFGKFEGGELWIEDADFGPGTPGAVQRVDAAGTVRYGKTVSTKEQVYTFDGKIQILGSEMNSENYVFHFVAFLLSEDNYLEQIEIGGVTKTIEAADMQYYTAEPFAYEFDESQDVNTSMVQETVEAFDPAVIWVHGDKANIFLAEIAEILYEHVEKGRQLALEAPRDDPCWNSSTMKELLDRYEDRCVRRDTEPNVVRINDIFYHPTPTSTDPSHPILEQYMAQHLNQEERDEDAANSSRGAAAITFEKGKTIAPEVRSSLKRLHQNLGHPSNVDLARHLRLAGADPSVVEACKRLRCQVCERSQRGSSAKPAKLPNLLDFNQVVAVDAFYVYDTNKVKVELMIAIDVGTSFISAGPLLGHSTPTMEASFCAIWSNTFGAPGTLVLDLESGLQSGLGRYSEWHGTHLRPIAGQAHWQNGAVERAIRTWKEIWVRLVDEKTATFDEAGMVITAVNSAMNTLRRDSGFSPAQAVWGRDPKLPEDLRSGPQDEHVEHIISHDRQRAREHTLRISAKEAYFKCQNDARLRRSLLQRSRVAGPELEVGAHVFFYCKPKNNKNWEWHGPAVVIGKEGPNTWVSFTGRCHLVAPEHLRTASAEELGAAFALRATQEDLQRLLEQDFADENTFENEDMEVEQDPELQPGDADPPQDEGGTRRRVNPTQPPPVTKRHRVKGPPSDEAMSVDHEVFMMKLPKTPRGREKALEKEIPWRLIPESQHEAFRQAELKQWREHVDHQALLPLSVEESRAIAQDRPHRILGSRFAYKDKLWCQRKTNPEVGWKPKAHLVIHGHRDPDLMKGLATHAPTISRQGIHLLLQVLASNLKKGWRGFAGDVTAAFLCGEQLDRELFLRQPATGLGDLHPEQLLRIQKPIFGLVDSPSAWWAKFHRTVKELEIQYDQRRWRIVQNTLDHCIFMVQEVITNATKDDEVLGAPQAYLGVHVDDVLLVGDAELCEVVKARLSAEFPIREWEADCFEYVGSYIEIFPDKVKISQGSYVTTRLFQVEVDREKPDHCPADEVQRHDNLSLVGALSWLASQTRPDL